MSLVDTVRQAAGMRLVDEDGHAETLALLPPLTAEELQALRSALPCPLPSDVEALLRYTRGFASGPLESVVFSGLPEGFGQEDVFPHGLPIGHDGYGNYWVVDLTTRSAQWGPIFFACHDPPVVAYQCADLEAFITQLLRLGTPPHASDLDTVHEAVVASIWRHHPGAIPAERARAAGDETLRAFAATLDDTFCVIDLRAASLGDGFAWGRFGPRTVVRRFGEARIFAYQRKSRLQRLLGR